MRHLSKLIAPVFIFVFIQPVKAQHRLINDKYDSHKTDAVGWLRDKYCLYENRDKKDPDIRKIKKLCNADAETEKNKIDSECKDQGDSAWRTGLACLCFALEKDKQNTLDCLTALRKHCWHNCKPIRHPTKRDDDFTRDQFIPQMAACFFAFEFGDAEVKTEAKALFSLFVNEARVNDWNMNKGDNCRISLGNQFAFFETADRLGLADSKKISTASGRKPRIAFVAAVTEKAFELEHPELIHSARQVENIVEGSWDALSTFGKKTDQLRKYKDADEVIDSYGIHLMFLESLIVIKCRPQTDGLIPAVHRLARASKAQNMGPLLWLVGDIETAKAYLENWKPEWNKTDYVWQRSRIAQENDAKSDDNMYYPRLDYMLLRNLLLHDDKIAIRR